MKVKYISWNETSRMWDIVCEDNSNHRVHYETFRREYAEDVRLVDMGNFAPVAMNHTEWCDYLNTSIGREELKLRIGLILDKEKKAKEIRDAMVIRARDYELEHTDLNQTDHIDNNLTIFGQINP